MGASAQKGPKLSGNFDPPMVSSTGRSRQVTLEQWQRPRKQTPKP